MKYSDFIAGKRLVAPPTGIENPGALNPALFPFQADIVRWALRRGRAAIWADCGLGKSWMALEWARVVCAESQGDVLIATPLAVAAQFVREGAKLGMKVTHAREADDVRAGINVTNYERLHKFDTSRFAGVVPDESSILKDYTSATRNAMIDAFARTPYRLACTATPAPNDHMELGNHAEFLGVMSRTEMLSMFFVHDGGATQDWRLKGHAVRDFWRWVCSWAVAVRSPADLGYSDDGFVLPPLNVNERVVSVGAEFARSQGSLFAVEARGLSEQREARKTSLPDRVAVAAEIVNREPDETWIVWCDLNDESTALTAAIPGAVELTGVMESDQKEAILDRFLGGCTCDKLLNGDSQDSQTTGHGVTQPIQHSGSGDVVSDRGHQKRIETTCAPIMSGTRSDGRGEAGSKETDTTLLAEKSTPPIPSTESGSSVKQRSRRTRSAKDGSERRSESPGTTTRECSQASAVSAPSADANRSGDCQSTTAIEPAGSEVSCAQDATSGSDNSTTHRQCLSARLCTCGGPIRVLVSKPSICGFGINAQHCARAVYVGLSHSFEAWYQSIRRIYRFGQKRAVECHVVTSDAEGAVIANLKRKQADADRMVRGMVAEMGEFTNVGATKRDATAYTPKVPMTIPPWIFEEDAA